MSESPTVERGSEGNFRLESDFLRLDFDAFSKSFSVTDRVSGKRLLVGADVGSDATRICASQPAKLIAPDTSDCGLGHARFLSLELPGEEGVNLIWEAALVPDLPILFFRVGVKNGGQVPVQLRRAYPCRSGLFLVDQISSKTVALTLDGLAGAGTNRVEQGLLRRSPNNLLLFLPELGRCLVAGGSMYRDFAKYLETAVGPESKGVRLTLETWDPVGRIIDPTECYLADDWFYLDLLGTCPFEALERFGRMVRVVNHANPCPYDFPTVCGWYASTPGYGAGEWINDTNGLVGELDEAERRGFLRYSRLGVRLVPDTYDGTSSRHKNPRDAGLDPRIYSADRNTEQGWWDDDHWQRFGHYTKPYETSASWASAVKSRGGVPITYVQTGHVSYDYAKAFPGHMLGNNITDLDRIFIGHHPYVKYDYTDPAFRDHLLEVWGRLGKAGVQGVFFDYPDQAWIENGGFEDRKATTTSAYRGVYDLVKPALGEETFIQERNVSRLCPYLDVTVGLVDSQRVWGDTDGVSAEMFRMCALRWYKTRTLYTYDTDAKNLLKIAARGREALRQVLTMLYLTSGRILLANSFRVLSPEIIHDLSRLFPAHREPLSPRPLDAFSGEAIPKVYDLTLAPDWHQITFFNPEPDKECDIAVALSVRPASGGVGLSPHLDYHVWDFWNDLGQGLVKGADRLREVLRPGEARMLSLRQRLPHPQVVSTNRHILQGWVELAEVIWSSGQNSLLGRWCSIPGEPMTITVACNGYEPATAKGGSGTTGIETVNIGAEKYARVTLVSDASGWNDWSVGFLRPAISE